MAIKQKSKHEFVVSVPLNKPVTNSDLADMRQWCTDSFGPGGRKREYRWRFGWIHRTSDMFYFRNKNDALMFVLRWS